MTTSALPTALVAVTEAASSGEMRWLRDVLNVDRTVGFLAMATLIGGWVFVALVWPSGAAVGRTLKVLGAAWLAAFVTTLGGLCLQGAIGQNRGFAGVVDGEVLTDILDSDPGRAWASRAMMLLLALPLLGALVRDREHAARATWWRVGVLVIAGGLVRTRGFVSHTSVTDQSVLGAVANFVHIAAIAVWLGGLILLAFVVLPRRNPRELADVLPRYSTIAQYAVGVLVVAGGALTWIVVGGLGDLVGTHYGRVLLIKLVIFAGLMAAAAFSKRWVDGRLQRAAAVATETATLRGITVPVLAEIVLAVALMGISAGLVSTPPGA